MPVPDGTSTATASGNRIAVSSQDEAAALSRAISERSPSALNDLATRYPSSRGIAPLFNSMPSRTLSALSPRAVAGIAPEVAAQFSPSTRAALPGQRVATSTPRTAPRQNTARQNILGGEGESRGGY